jgi:hypothetical protein
MKTRTTLTLKKELVKKAKSYCKKEDRSLSGLVDELLEMFLVNKDIISPKASELTLNEIKEIVNKQIDKRFNDDIDDIENKII